MEGDDLQSPPTSSCEIHDFRQGWKSKFENERIPSGELVEDTKIEKGKEKEGEVIGCPSGEGACAICLDEISLQEIALLKGCEHAYCVTCILRWATYRKNQTCPQCLNPFTSLQTHRSLDGSIHDYMLEESVCLLLRAAWFNPVLVESSEEVDEDMFLYYPEGEEEEEEMAGDYGFGSLSLRIGNRRWGDNGYIRSGRQQARPAPRHDLHRDPGSGSGLRKSDVKGGGSASGGGLGRRAKRSMKRQAATSVEDVGI